MLLLGCALLPAAAIHVADNGDGTFTNPVMPNAHWSDPAVVRHNNDYYVVTSSIETTPSLQILHSTDLVNFDVIGTECQVSHFAVKSSYKVKNFIRL